MAAFVASAASFWPYTVDDAYISLRYARNLAAGRGLVFSYDGSAPVEGYTNFLWVVLQAPFTLLKSQAGMIDGLKVLGIAAGLVAIALTYRLARLLGASCRSASVAALLLSATSYFAFWSVGGLETALYAALLLAATCALLYELSRESSHLPSGALFALAAMTRPEAAAIGVVMLSLAVWIERRRTLHGRLLVLEVATGLTGFAVLYAPYFLWRYSFYGYLLPNTFYAKTGVTDTAWIWGRLLQLAPFLALMIPVALLLPLLTKSGFLNRPGGKALMMATGLVAASSMIARIEWMPAFRYEVPVLPFVSVITALGLVQLRRRFGPTPAQTRCLVAGVALALFLASSILPAKALVYVDELAGAHVQLGYWLRNHAGEVRSLAGWDMGAIPFFSDVPTAIEISPEGLLSNDIAHGTYDIDTMMAEVVVLPPDNGGVDGMQEFYRSEVFRTGYKRLFAVAFRPDYILVVHVRRDVVLSDDAVSEGLELQALSFSRYGVTPEVPSTRP